MSEPISLPSWATYLEDPPMVTRYSGPADKAIKWGVSTTRIRYLINVNGRTIDVNKAQAEAIAEMIDASL